MVLVAGRFRVTVARTTPCGPVNPAAEKGRLTEVVTSVAILNGVAVPMVVPAALRNATLPSHDAAVPAWEAAATLVKLIRAVSVVPRPNGGRAVVRVDAAVVVVTGCAIAESAVKPATAIRFKYV